MPTCSTCAQLQDVIRLKDEEIQSLKNVSSSNASFLQLEAEKRSLLNNLRDSSLQIERLNVNLETEKRNTVQKELELSTKIKELEKQVNTLKQASGNSSLDLDRVLSQIVYKDNRILELNNTILDKERQILDLQELCHEQGQVAQAKHQAMQIVQQKIMEFESRRTCNASTETDLSLVAKQPKLRTGGPPGHAVAQKKFGNRSSPPPLDPSEELSPFYNDLNGLEDDDDEPGTSRSLSLKKNRKKVTFDLPPLPASASSSTTNLQNDQIADMAQRIEDLTAENELLCQTCSDLEKIEIQNLKERIASLEDDLKASKQEGTNHVLKARAAAQGRIKDLEERIASMQVDHHDEVEKLRTGIDTLTDAREWAIIERAKLQDEVDTYKMRLQDMQEKYCEHQQEVFDLEHRLSQEAQFSERLVDDVQEAQFTANQLLEQKQMILDDVERLKEALLAQEELIGVLESDIRIYEEHIGILRDSLGTTNKENRQIIKSKAFETKIRALEKEKDQMDKRNNDERLRTKALNAKMKALRIENEELREQLREALDAIPSRPQPAVPEVQDQSDEVKSAVELQRKAEEELMQANSEVESFRTQLQDLSEQLHIVRCDNFDLQSELSRMKDCNLKLEEQLNENEKNQKEIVMRLTSAIPKAELQREIEQPSAPPDYRIIVRKVGSFLETSLPADLLSGTILEKIDVLESKLVNSRAKLEKLQKHLASAEESRDMNIDLMEQMSKQMREMGGLLEDRQVQVDSLQKANEELMEELDALSSDRAEKSENEICRTAMLEDELRTKNEESQILQTQVGQLQDALRELSITNDSVENGRREMETKVSEFQVIFDELRGSEGVWQVQLTGLKEEVKRLTQENEMYVKDREADDAEFTTLKDDLNVKINEVENLRLTITDLENDVQNLTTELVNLREENNVFSVRQTLATTSSAIEPTIPQPVDTRELFSGEHAELKRTTSGLLRKENEMLRECVSETDQLHDELAEEVHVMMVLNRDLENAVDALKGEVWALNGKLKACLVEREELLAKWETAGETEMALHDLQKAFNEVVSKKTRDIGTDPLENPDASKEEVQKYRELLANVSEELQTLRGRDMQTVKDVVKEFEKAFMAMQKSAEPLLANSQSLAMRAMSSASHLHLAILAAKLTTKQADNDALFRANAELAHTNVGLQNQLEELQEKLDEALEANDRFIMDGQQQTEEKVAHLSNVIRSLEDRLELTENLNRELEDKCYEAEQMLSSNKQFEELLEVQKQQMRSSGWNEWDNEASDSEGNRGKHGCSKFEECLEKDTIIEEVKGDIEEKKTQTCVDCADKMDEIKKLVMKVAEQEDELNSVKESFEKQLESELAGFAEQLQCTASAVMEEVAKVQEPMKVEGGSDWDDWHSDASAEEEATPSPQRPAQAKCQMCPRKDEDIVELKTAIEEKEQEVSFLKCRKCPDCYSKEDELNDFAFKLIEKDEDMSMLKEKFEAERANLLDQLKQSEALLVTKTAVEAESAAGWDDWNADITEPEAANPKKASIQESCEGCTEKEGVLENLRSEIADVTEKMRLACFSKDDQLTALQLRLTEMDEERNALKESYEKRLAVERVNVGEQLRQANEAAKLQAALELKNDTEENTGWDNWSADGAEAEDCGSPPAQQSCQSCLMKDADLEELQTQKSALGEELTMDRVRHKKQVEDFERQLNEKNQEIRNLSDNFRMRLKADQFKFAEELQQAVEAAKGEERNKKDAGGRKKEGSDWGDWDFDSEETTIAQQKEVPAAHKCQCYALKDADICDLRAALSKKSEDMEAMKKEFDKRLQMEKTKFAEQLKQATSVVATTSKDRTENNDEKLFEMTRQRNEAMKKVAELQKRLRSSQQKRISSVASIASSSASSQQRLNDPHELSLSSFENSTALKPVITRSIQSNAYLALVCPDVSLGSDDPLRRRMKK